MLLDSWNDRLPDSTRKRVAASVAATLLVALTVFPVWPVWAAEEGRHESWVPTAGRIFNFVVLAGTLVYLLRKPLAEYLAARTEQVRKELQEAATKRRQAEEDRATAESRLRNLDADIAEIRARAVREAEGERARILAAAEDEAERIREGARKEIGTELELARRKIVSHATELAVGLARKKIETNITGKDREALFEKGLRSLEEVR